MPFSLAASAAFRPAAPCSDGQEIKYCRVIRTGIVGQVGRRIHSFDKPCAMASSDHRRPCQIPNNTKPRDIPLVVRLQFRRRWDMSPLLRMASSGLLSIGLYPGHLST